VVAVKAGASGEAWRRRRRRRDFKNAKRRKAQSVVVGKTRLIVVSRQRIFSLRTPGTVDPARTARRRLDKRPQQT